MTVAVISMIRDAWGGSEELWYDMAKAALVEGHRVIHLRYESGSVHTKITELEAAGAICYQRPGYVKPGSGRWSKLVQQGVNFLRRKIRDPFSQVFRHHPDVVLYNGTCYSIAGEKGLLKRVVHSGARFFIIGHLNSDLLRDLNESQAARVLTAYRQSQQVFFVSKRSMQTAQRHLCATIPNASLIRNPVNLADTSTMAFPNLGNRVQLAVVGNLATVHKGQDILLHVLSSPEWKERSWQLNVYGTGPDEAYLKCLAAYFSLNEKVVFHGKVSDIRRVWEHNHLLLMPSHMEGMPLAVVEAMLCARPCLVSDVGGNAEWIEDGITGFISQVASVQAFGQALERAWLMRENWQDMGIRARAAALQRYDPQAGKTLLNKLKTKDAA